MIAEIPLDTQTAPEDEEVIIKKPDDLNELEENVEINSENPEEIIINEPEIPKKTRGRPKGSAKPKADAKPKAAPKEAKQKLKPVPKPKKKQVQYDSSSSDDDLPEYVRQEVAPTRDLATQMLKLLQGHESIRSARKRQLYTSWFAHH